MKIYSRFFVFTIFNVGVFGQVCKDDAEHSSQLPSRSSRKGSNSILKGLWKKFFHRTEETNTQPSNYYVKACNEVLYPSELTDIPHSPSVWQENNCYDNPDAVASYDLALVGAGIGSAYVANKIRYGNPHKLKIALFEAGDQVGGRLVSSFQEGALGLTARPFEAEINIVPAEYGGMRIAPLKYPLIFKEVEILWQKHFKDEIKYPNAKCTSEFCLVLKNQDLCCEGLLVPMNVGNVAYFTDHGYDNPNPILTNATLKDKNPIYTDKGVYRVENIQDYLIHSTYIKAVLLVVGVQNYTEHFKSQTDYTLEMADKGFKRACSSPNCKYVGEAFCELCTLFPFPADAAISISGYDMDVTKSSTDYIIGLMDEVVNISGKTHLYVFTIGYQRFAQELLAGTKKESDNPDKYRTLDIAPHFRKKLVAIGVGPGRFKKAVTRARNLAKNQANRYLGKAVKDLGNEYTGPIRLKFEDGSITTSSLAYLTMTPYDAVDKVEGFEPWRKIVHNGLVSTSTFKAVLAWDNFSLANELNLKPCVVIKNEAARGSLCDRLILDGDHTGPNGQLVRQAWLWDYKQIMIYEVGGENTPSANSINFNKKNGMEAFVKKVVGELQKAVDGLHSPLGHNITIPQPAWVRSKSWPDGSILPTFTSQNKNETKSLSNHFRRPFGKSANVWYGNSEMAENEDFHGWAEGALSMANTSLPELKEGLGLLKSTEKNVG